MQPTSKNEIKQEFDKIAKLYDCYRFAVSNADDENLKKRITEIAQAHLLSKVDALVYSVKIPADMRMDELRKRIAELGR